MEEKKKYWYIKCSLAANRPYDENNSTVYIITYGSRIMYDSSLAAGVKIATVKFHQILIKKFNAKLYRGLRTIDNRIYFEYENDVKAAVEYLDALYLARKLKEGLM